MSRNDKNECCFGDEGNGPHCKSLPDYYPSVAEDILRLCRPREGGCWVDLGSGRGQVALSLAEVYRVLCEGGQAMIGGGLGNTYPVWARRELIRRRHDDVRRKGPEAYNRFLHLRDPRTFAAWAKEAGIPEFEVVGEGGRPVEDPRAGLGVWLRFERGGEDDECSDRG